MAERQSPDGKTPTVVTPVRPKSVPRIASVTKFRQGVMRKLWSMTKSYGDGDVANIQLH